jgi:hypothetical protein
LNIFPVLDPIVQILGRAEIAEHGLTGTLWRVELTRKKDGSSINFLSRRRFIKLLIFERLEHGLVCANQDVCLFDVSMRNMALIVQKIQSVEQTLERMGNNSCWQLFYRIAMSDMKYAFPKWRVHKALMSPAWTFNFKRVQQRADSSAAWVILRRFVNELENVEFRFLFCSYGFGIDEEFESNVTAFTTTAI